MGDELQKLTFKDLELIEDAKKLVKMRHSKLSEVASSLRTKSGKICNGLNVLLPMAAPSSVCAEYSAITKMLSEGEKGPTTIVAVRLKNKRFEILKPCGNCRQFISEFGNPFVIVSVKAKIKLNELYPYQYH